MELEGESLDDIFALEGILPLPVLYDKVKSHLLAATKRIEELQEEVKSLKQDKHELKQRVRHHEEKDERLKGIIGKLHGIMRGCF